MVNAGGKKTPRGRGACMPAGSGRGKQTTTPPLAPPVGNPWIQNSFISGPLQETVVTTLNEESPSGSKGHRPSRSHKLPKRYRDSDIELDLSPAPLEKYTAPSPIRSIRSTQKRKGCPRGGKAAWGRVNKNVKSEEDDFYSDSGDSVLAAIDIDELIQDVRDENIQPTTSAVVGQNSLNTPPKALDRKSTNSLGQKRQAANADEETPKPGSKRRGTVTPKRGARTSNRKVLTPSSAVSKSSPVTHQTSSPLLIRSPPSDDHVYSVMDIDDLDELTQRPKHARLDDEEAEEFHNPMSEADDVLAGSFRDDFDITVFSQGLPKDYVSDNLPRSQCLDALSDKLFAPYEPPQQSVPLFGKPVSFHERLKNTLLKNAQSVTAPNNAEQRRSREIENAMQEAAAIQAALSQRDIGPFYGLPSKVPNLLEDIRGIKNLYAWQHECLSLPAVRAGKNLIYSLPTSGGKTLVSEILIMREILCKQRDVIFILPFVAIVQEKVRSLNPFGLELDFLVEEYAAHKGYFPPRKRRIHRSLYICTIEKANGLINSLIELNRMNEIGLIVVDELHMLGEGSRGAILEMTLAKVMHAAEKTQVVGMSATLSNTKDLSLFLNAEVYTNDFRPVELIEYLKVEDTIYEIDSKTLVPADRLRHSRVLTYQKKIGDPDYLSDLVLEVVPTHSCLIFCPTKKNCENVAELICRNFPQTVMQEKLEEKKTLYRALLRDGDGEVCPVLRRTLPFGVAYHHSGLTMDERRLLEDAYLEGTLCVLCCTSTLAAGVNLPAKRVIIRSPYVGLEFLGRSQYKQMVGRAGRAGLDDSGESILIAHKNEMKKLEALIDGPLNSCVSSLLQDENKGMRRLLLASIGLQVTKDISSLMDFLKKTLCYVQRSRLEINMLEMAQNALQQIADMGLIVQKVKADSGTTLEVTRLGRAVFKGCIDLDQGPRLYRDLNEAQQSLVLSNYLHLLYLVTPYDLVEMTRPNWMLYLEELNNLTEVELLVAKHVGVTEATVAKKLTHQTARKNVDEFVVKRFYLTLMMYHLWRGRTIWDVASRFQLPRGLIQNLLNSATAFASCISHFCQELEEFWAYQDLFVNFVKKLSCGFMMELGPLLDIPGVKLGRARQLAKAGYKTLQQVAHADPETLVLKIENLPKKTACQIVISAQMLVQEKLEALQEEALDIITIPAVAIETEVSTTENELPFQDGAT